MFWHNFKYELIASIRVKDILFWMILFPIVLGAFFKIAFSNIYEETTAFSTIPVAVVESQENTVFHTVMDSVAEEDEPLFEPTYTDEKKALSLLENQDVFGIIYTGTDLSLTVSNDGIEQTIIKSFVEQYTVQEKIITDTMQNHPEQLEAVIASLNASVSSNEDIPLTTGNTDNLIPYFYNLIAMVALFGSVTGLHVAISSQGNLSSLGARKCCSPTPKSVSLFASLLGSYVTQTLCILISISYLAFILRVDFGSQLPFVYLSGIIGGILGVSMGFMIGSFGKMSQNAKTGIAMTASMLSCFLSGLMVGNMKAVIAEKLPWFNEINPAALISDTFYCLNVYSDHDRYLQKNITMLIITAIFVTIGILLTRRRKYASL